MRVVLVDDHDLFRTGLREIFSEHAIDVVGEASNGNDAVALVERVRPDVVVMDLSMPGISGVEATRRLAARLPGTQVVVLSISADDDDVLDAMVAGASGYLLKDASIEQLVGGVEAAARGESSISPRVAARLVTHVRQHAGPRAGNEPHEELSQREVEVLRLLAAGKDNSQIAGELFISPRTVKNHIASILMKLHMTNRIQAAVYAVKSGLV